MAKKHFVDTLLGNFCKHFLFGAMTLYAYELTQGLDIFHFDLTILKKFATAGMVAAFPVLLNYFNPNDARFGRKPKAPNFPTEKTKIKP